MFVGWVTGGEKVRVGWVPVGVGWVGSMMAVRLGEVAARMLTLEGFEVSVAMSRQMWWLACGA